MTRRVLLSTIGSRGDVQPLVALATELAVLGHEPVLCVPPDFCAWIASLGFRVSPIGPELRATGRTNPAASPPTAEQVKQMIEGTVATQFETIANAARDCDVIVGATALQVAAPSVAESLGLRYVFAAYCPAVLPSAERPPPRIPHAPPARGDHRAQWEADAARWNAMWGPAVNARRAALGLTPVADVRGYVLTADPWLAADPVLAPCASAVFQPGAWILDDARPLDTALERFLDGGEPPIYLGFGSIRAPEHLARTVIEAARAQGRRVILSAGWAELRLVDDVPDCISIGETNQQRLFQRVAAIVHHGGAGTTTAAARAGAPQIVIPQHYDQPYWAERVQQLGIGACATLETINDALARALQPDVAMRARELAGRVRGDGARVAAARL